MTWSTWELSARPYLLVLPRLLVYWCTMLMLQFLPRGQPSQRT